MVNSSTIVNSSATVDGITYVSEEVRRPIDVDNPMVHIMISYNTHCETMNAADRQ